MTDSNKEILRVRPPEEQQNSPLIMVFLLIGADSEPSLTMFMHHVPRVGDYFDMDIHTQTGVETVFTAEALQKVEHLKRRLSCAPAWEVSAVQFRHRKSYLAAGDIADSTVAWIRLTPCKPF